MVTNDTRKKTQYTDMRRVKGGRTAGAAMVTGKLS